MKRKLSFLFVLVLIFCSFGIIGCTSKDDICGSWVRSSNATVYFLTFNKDGTLWEEKYADTMSGYVKHSEVIESNWELIKDNTYKANSVEWELKRNKLTRVSDSSIVFEKIDISIEEYIENLKNS